MLALFRTLNILLFVVCLKGVVDDTGSDPVGGDFWLSDALPDRQHMVGGQNGQDTSLVFTESWRRPIKGVDKGLGHFLADGKVLPAQRKLKLDILESEETCLEVDLVPFSLI
jgi:hypothetical protein